MLLVWEEGLIQLRSWRLVIEERGAKLCSGREIFEVKIHEYHHLIGIYYGSYSDGSGTFRKAEIYLHLGEPS